MSLHDVRFKATAKTNTVLEAAKIIGVTDRTRRRSREHFDTSGYPKKSSWNLIPPLASACRAPAEP
jgi:hypothetical protein